MNRLAVSTIVFVFLFTQFDFSYAFGPGLRGSTSNITRSLRQQVRQALKPVLYINEAEKAPMLQIALDKSGRYLVSLQPATVIVWDLQHGQPLLREDIDAGQVQQIYLEDLTDGIWLQLKNGPLQRWQLQADGIRQETMPSSSLPAAAISSRQPSVLGSYNGSDVIWAGSGLLRFLASTGQPKELQLEMLKQTGLRDAVMLKPGLVLLLGDDGLGYVVDLSQRKVTMRWIVTRQGWAVVDDSGRFAGDIGGVREIAWAVAQRKLDMSGFAERYYEPGLLSRLMKSSPKPLINADSKPLHEGIFLPPEVTLQILTRHGSQQEIEVIAQVTTADDLQHIQNVFLYHNGKRVDSSMQIDSQRDAAALRVIWRFRVPLVSGENSLHAAVTGWQSIRAYSEPAQVSLTRAERSPEMVITSVGINQYQSSELELNYAVADARAVAETFTGQLQDSKRNTSKTLLLDLDATGQQLRQRLHALTQLGADDVAIVYLSGHGVVHDGQWYFLPREAQSLEDPRHVKAVGLAADELANAITRAPVQKVLLAVDACQSGAVVDSFESFFQLKALQQVADDSGVHVLTATRADQLAPEFSQLGHGLFTYTLLKGLQPVDGRYPADNWPADGNLTVSELKRYVFTYAPLLARYLSAQGELAAGERGEGDLQVLVSPAQLTRGNDFSLINP